MNSVYCKFEGGFLYLGWAGLEWVTLAAVYIYPPFSRGMMSWADVWRASCGTKIHYRRAWVGTLADGLEMCVVIML
jgi:hypothetical protein